MSTAHRPAHGISAPQTLADTVLRRPEAATEAATPTEAADAAPVVPRQTHASAAAAAATTPLPVAVGEVAAQPGTVAVALAAYHAQVERAAACDAALAAWQRQAAEAFAAGRWTTAGDLWARAREVALHRPELNDRPEQWTAARKELVEVLWQRVRTLESMTPTPNHLPHIGVRPQLMRWLGSNGMYNADHWPPRLTGDESTAERATNDIIDRTARLRNSIPDAVGNMNPLPAFVQSIQDLHTLCQGIEADLPRAWRAIARARAVRQPSGVGDNFSTAAGWHWQGDEIEGHWEHTDYPIPQGALGTPRRRTPVEDHESDEPAAAWLA